MFFYDIESIDIQLAVWCMLEEIYGIVSRIETSWTPVLSSRPLLNHPNGAKRGFKVHDRVKIAPTRILTILYAIQY